MKIYYCFSLVLLLLTSCTPKMSISWKANEYQGRSYSKIAVVGITEDLNARSLFERDAVQLLRENGINAIEGITIFPPKISPKAGDDEEIIRILKENNIDGVITMGLINSSESQRYEPGITYRIPSGYRRFGNYYYRTYNYVSSPGYYRDEKSYLIEAVLYDVAGELQEGQNTLAWTGQSSLIDPSSTEWASYDFTQRMVNQLIEDGIILPE